MTTKNYARSVRAKLLQEAINLPRSLDLYHTGTETIYGKIKVLRYRPGGREGADALVKRTDEGHRGHLRQAEVQEDAF